MRTKERFVFVFFFVPFALRVLRETSDRLIGQFENLA